jgi:hypothetical protein
VYQVLQNKIFDEIRIPELERSASSKFVLECDEIDDTQLDLPKMRKILSNEI